LSGKTLPQGERLIWLMDGATYVASAYLGVVSTDWVIVGTGDFNNDGNYDIIWQNLVTGDRAIWLMSGTSYLSNVSPGSAAGVWAIAN